VRQADEHSCRNIRSPGRRREDSIVAVYRERTTRSAALRSSSAKFLPGGINRNIVNFDPHPLFVTRGEGAYLFDEDGNRYLDCIGNYTSMVIGHTHPRSRRR